MRKTSPRILLVEDQLRLATLRRTVLSDHRYDVMCVADGKQACRLLRRKRFDLVLTNAKLPKGSGWEVATVAKEKNLPVILTSAWSHQMSPEEIARGSVDFVVPQPCSNDRLLAIIRTALKKA